MGKWGPRQRLKGQMSGREEEVARGRMRREGTEDVEIEIGKRVRSLPAFKSWVFEKSEQRRN